MLANASGDSYRRTAGIGALCGAFAGALTGVVEVVFLWSSLGQFVPGAGGKIATFLYVAILYALFGAMMTAIGAVCWRGFSRHTRAGAIGRAHRQGRERGPEHAVTGLAFAIAGVPVIAITFAAGYAFAYGTLAGRHHIGLVIAVAMILALAAAAAAAVLTIIIARPIELGLSRAARHRRLGPILACSYAPAIAILALGCAALAIFAATTWSTLSLLSLRPMVATIGFSMLLVPGTWAARATVAAVARRWPPGPAFWPRRIILAAAILVAVAIVLVLGGMDPVRKAATTGKTSLAEILTATLRRAVDVDGDGFSPILGGGDCDDFTAEVHPGGIEVPGDGLDQNCVGGDPSTTHSASDVGFAPIPAAIPKDLNVILITIDTLRADHLGTYGYDRPTSPNLDALGKRSTVFANAWAHAPSTRYSIPAILTGRYPLAVIYDYSVWWPGLSPENTTIAEIMQGRGRFTGAITNYRYFDRKRHMDQGFASYDNTNQRLHRATPGKGPEETHGSSSRAQSDKAIAFVTAHAGAPFFLWVHYYDPHFGYERHSGFPDFGDRDVDRYDQEIRYTDHHIGRLLSALTHLGIAGRTAIVVTGDHGEGFGEHGINLHGYDLYAAQTRVPLIIHVPGIAPKRIAMPAGHVDILPTLANLVGARPSAEMMGLSLLGVITGAVAPDPHRLVFQQLSYENHHEMRAAAGKRCHIIYNVSPDTSWELYRIDIDPAETRDVISDPGPCAGARGALEAWYDQSELPAGAAAALLAERPAIAHPIHVAFGDEVVLLGVDLPTAPVSRGQSFAVTYTFAATGTLSGNWKVFAHFESPQGGRFLGDHAPPRPFSWWKKGQFIRYSHTQTVPKNARPGDYSLWLGLFEKSARRPASSHDVVIRDDRAKVGTITVK